MNRQQLIIRQLADGNFHSGEEIARQLGISRAAVSKRIKQLEKLGLDVFSVNGKGHRLSHPLECIDAKLLRQYMGDETYEGLSELLLFDETDSTNKFLHERLNQQSIHAVAVVAEYQHQGKGRRGNQWVSPFASGICFSFGWHFDNTPASYGALSLAVGVAVCRCLARLGVKQHGLKWPNDIVVNGSKLGGILVESRGESAGYNDTIIGIGLNFKLPSEIKKKIEQDVIDLHSISEEPLLRNELCGILIDEVYRLLVLYEQKGFASCIEEWRQYDAYQKQDATIIFTDKSLHGEIQGIDEEGRLLMLIDGELKKFSNGEISLRLKQ